MHVGFIIIRGGIDLSFSFFVSKQLTSQAKLCVHRALLGFCHSMLHRREKALKNENSKH